MQSALDRRQGILEFVSDRRRLTYQDICNKFGISYNTARRDIEVLSCSYPILTIQGRNGGVRAMDGWYVSRRYLHDDQEELLRSFLPGLQPEERKKLEDILLAFAKPRKGEKNGIIQEIREGAESV